jgi:hypothetical protein
MLYTEPIKVTDDELRIRWYGCVHSKPSDPPLTHDGMETASIRRMCSSVHLVMR